MLWPLLLVVTAFMGAALDTRRRRWLRLATAAASWCRWRRRRRTGDAGHAVQPHPRRAIARGFRALDRLRRRIPDGDAYLVSARPPDAGGERWITPADDALLFYLFARRPTLFLYFLDHTARYGPAGLETTCAALQAERAEDC